MTFHFALVDDLIPREEFDRRVEEVMEASGDLLDEPTAAMIVVRNLGRTHVKIRDLGSGSSLSCFFGKVISTTSPHEFQKSDGSTGQVADILLGDETGQARVVLWDEKAQAAGEVEVGEVLEVIAKPSPRGKGEVSAMAFQKAACEIELRHGTRPAVSPPEPVAELEARVIEIGKIRTFTRRDGSEGRMVEAVIGNQEETSRLVCWAPELLEGIQAGSSVRILGATRSSKGDGEEYQMDEKGEVIPAREGYRGSHNRYREGPGLGAHLGEGGGPIHRPPPVLHHPQGAAFLGPEPHRIRRKRGDGPRPLGREGRPRHRRWGCRLPVPGPGPQGPGRGARTPRRAGKRRGPSGRGG